MSIKLGSIVKDTISGVEGVAVGKTIWLYGCVRVGVARRELDKDGRVQDTLWFDEDQLEVTSEPKGKAQLFAERAEAAVHGAAPVFATTGGPMDVETGSREETG